MTGFGLLLAAIIIYYGIDRYCETLIILAQGSPDMSKELARRAKNMHTLELKKQIRSRPQGEKRDVMIGVLSSRLPNDEFIEFCEELEED